MPRSLLAFTFVALFACERGTPLQLVDGHLVPSLSDLSEEILAIRGGEIVGTAPIDADGSFVLAIPTGDGIQFAVTSRWGRGSSRIESYRRGGPFEVRVCQPQQTPLQLGALGPEMTRCGPPAACLPAWGTLERCRSGDDLEGDVCFDCPVEGCEEEEALYLSCVHSSAPACDGAILVLVTESTVSEIGCPTP